MSRSSALVLSFAAHVTLIYAAFSQRPGIPMAGGDVVRVRPPSVERIRFIEIAAAAEPAKAIASPIKRAAATLAKLPRFHAPVIGPIAVGTMPDVPAIDLSSKVNAVDSSAASTNRVADFVKGLVADASSSNAPRTGPYSKDDVDKVVMPYTSNPKPAYPWGMQRQGIEASFVAQFVVDSTGRVDEKSIVFPPDARSQFTNEVRRALRRSRYYPAEVAGQRVTQLVEQRFTFILVNGRGDSRW